MKKLLLLITTICCLGIMNSCTKEGADESKYTFTHNFEGLTSCDIILFEYTESGDKVNSNSIDDCEKGKTYTFTATPQAVKVKVYAKYSTIFSSNTSKWVQQVYYLTKGGTTDIKVDGETIIGNKEP